jgi:hypothetical protein
MRTGSVGLALMGAGALLVAVAGGRLEPTADLADLAGFPTGMAGVASCALGGAALTWAAVSRGRPPVRAAWSYAVSFAAVELAVFLFLPALDPVKSARPMGEVIRAEAATTPLVLYPDTGGSRWDAFVLYGGRKMSSAPDGRSLGDWLASTQRPAHVLTYEGEVDRLPLDGTEPPRRLFESRVGHRTVVLLRYDEPPAPRPSRQPASSGAATGPAP